MDLDKALHSINDHGRGQLFILFLLSLMGQLPASWHIFAIVFLGIVPDHFCTPDSSEYDLDDWTTAVSPHDYSKCTRNNYENGSESCDSWTYAHDVTGSTIVSEWNLVCDRASFLELSQTALIIGVTIGSVTFGFLADRFGRKRVFFMSLFVQGLLGCIEASVSSIEVFIIVRLFIGIVDQGYELPTYTMVSEFFTPRCRPYTFPCIFIAWATGIMTLPLLAYFIRDWRYLQLAISIPLLFFPLFYWFVPESPRWLLSVGREEEARAVLRRIAKCNGRPNAVIDFSDEPETLKMKSLEADTGDTGFKRQDNSYREINTFEEEEEETDVRDDVKYSKLGQASYLDLFRGWQMTKVTVILFIIWLVSSVSYYGLTFHAGRLVGDMYVNFFLSGAVEIPSILLLMVLVVRFGRRVPLSVFFVISGIACFVTAFIPKTTANGGDLTAAIVTAAMIGKFSVTVSYQIICLCATEIFPTVVRNKGIGFVALSARIGAILAPFITAMEDHVAKFPMILFGSVSLVPCLLVFLLPEMKGRRQPQTIPDLEQIFEDCKHSKKQRLRNTDEA